MSSSGTALLLQPRVKVSGEYHIKEKQYLLISFNRPACLLDVATDTAKYLGQRGTQTRAAICFAGALPVITEGNPKLFIPNCVCSLF
jgi:hypothetical protein